MSDDKGQLSINDLFYTVTLPNAVAAALTNMETAEVMATLAGRAENSPRP